MVVHDKLTMMQERSKSEQICRLNPIHLRERNIMPDRTEKLKCSRTRGNWAVHSPEMKDAQSRGERLGVGASALDAGREAGISGCIFG